MDKKNVVGLLFFMGLLGVVISGMLAFQPDKASVKVESTAHYQMNAFPVLPNDY